MAFHRRLWRGRVVREKKKCFQGNQNNECETKEYQNIIFFCEGELFHAAKSIRYMGRRKGSRE